MLINDITVNLGYLSVNDDGSDFFAFLKRVDLHTVHNWLDIVNITHFKVEHSGKEQQGLVDCVRLERKKGSVNNAAQEGGAT